MDAGVVGVDGDESIVEGSGFISSDGRVPLHGTSKHRESGKVE